MVLPSIPETDVGKADAAPGEECSQTRKRLQPVEGDRSTGVERHECEWRPRKNEDGGPQRTAGAVDVGEEARCVTLLSERTQCTRSTVDTGKTNGNDGEHDDGVGEVGKSDDTSALGDDDERRGFNVDKTAAQKSGVVVVDEQTDECEGQNVEEGDTPEDLLDGRGQ